MTRADDLKRMLDPARQPNESPAAYRKRRALAALAVAQHMKGRLAHAGIRYGTVPPQGTDPAVDEQILRGNLRVVGHKEQFYTVVRIDKDGMPEETASRRMRVVRTKGTPYRKPQEAA